MSVKDSATTPPKAGEGEKFTIRLTISDKTYPLTVDRKMEEIYRRAERDINVLISKFKSRFHAEGIDYLAMAAIQIAVANVEAEMSRSLGEEIEELVKLEKQLDEYISSVE